MKKIILTLFCIFALTAIAYADDAASPNSNLALPVNGALCGAIAILYRQLIKTNDKLYAIIQEQQQVTKDMTTALTSLRDKLDGK